MKRWLPWLSIPLVLSAVVFFIRAQGMGLLDDSDTKVLLINIQERNNPLSWFWGDWPLFNHFYRPISTLTLELDLAIYGLNGSGFGTTNALIAIICIWLTFWLGRELFERPIYAALGTLIFGLCHINLGIVTSVFSLFWAFSFVTLAGFFRGNFKERIWPVLLALLGCAFLASLVPGPLDFKGRIIDWIPGRTASVMTVFSLISLAAYARFERITGHEKVRELTSVDLPATKGTVVSSTGRAPWIWVVVSALSLILALGSYEQAVIVPGLISGIMILFKLQGRTIHALNNFLFWGILIGYLILRNQMVPSEVSGYQAQQFRSGIGVYLDLARYLIPGFTGLPPIIGSLEVGIFAILMGSVWALITGFLGNITTLYGIWKDKNRWVGIGLLLMGFVAFLPMAWLKFFSHYHYLPSVFYSFLLVIIGQAVLTWVVEALSPTHVLAPPRSEQPK